ncbi:hypothetical protein B0T17DRAFT_614287 [Bombardia bombarda]|uniref:Major facilitator superfamily (MFS) profile domain-containing protein n=1 Tax=Bombardia bombarda TaxID=252184 RepID=A0AA40C806_9PEZI|nr:hypothetical protein B0T17DRAFT_614287 [Bombardia bombarda]
MALYEIKSNETAKAIETEKQSPAGVLALSLHNLSNGSDDDEPLVSLVGAGAQGQTIAAHFHSSGSAVWFQSPITITTVVLGPIVVQADYWGRKWFLVILTLFGAVGSLIVAQAESINTAIAGFSVIRIAFSVQPLLHVVTSEVLPRR